jgi:SAM-dependent methyltransferase
MLPVMNPEGHRLPIRGNLGLKRSLRLFRLFLSEQSDPDRFYADVAEDAVGQVAAYTPVEGRTVLDVGGGPGHFTRAFRARGAACYLFEPDRAAVYGRGEAPRGAVIADGFRLPVRDAGADVCFSANVLEHVPDPAGFVGEMVRVTRPGGLIYLSFTNWYSPWGGHEMSPWHYLGAGFAERRYVRRHHRLPKNRCGTGLFPLHIGPTMRMLRSRGDLEILDALPRYYPRWCRAVVRVPGVREIATWNLLVVMRRTVDREPAALTADRAESAALS